MSSNLSIFKGDYIPSECSIVFFPGCSLSGYSCEIVESTFNYLSSKIDNLGLIVGCCSKPSLDIKDTSKHEVMENNLKEKLYTKGIKKIITACSNCYMMFNNYKDIEVISLWQVLDNVMGDDFKGRGEGIDLSITIHDPCPTRKEIIIHDSVRNILNSCGFKFQEFSNCRDKTICCGAKGMMLAKNPDIAKKLMKRRADSASTMRIVSYCESCVQSMLIGGKESMHILDLLFNDKYIENKCKSQSLIPLKGHWMERRKTALITRSKK
ncbi:MAG: (Fe-S)-binding protein [Cellulosilyticaceae bacterium]